MIETGVAAGGGGAWRRDVEMARFSSWRAGGRVRWLFTPAAAAECLDLAPPSEGGGEAPLLFVGLGSNLLVRDGGYDGIVVRTAPGLGDLARRADGSVVAWAGAGCPKLARFCAAAGLEAAFFAGIPGTVGGALAMNAGCHGCETWEFVREVTVFEDGAMRRMTPEAFLVGYRNVRRRDGREACFAAARFEFARGEEAAVTARVRELLRMRADSQPIGSACAGSVFCNPPGDFAGRLVESCGLKGTRVGGAVVSEKHANFIVNEGGATAADIEGLIDLVRRRVEARTGVCLRPEVRIVGRAA